MTLTDTQKTEIQDQPKESMRKQYTTPRIEKKRSVLRVTLTSGGEGLIATPATPPPAA